MKRENNIKKGTPLTIEYLDEKLIGLIGYMDNRFDQIDKRLDGIDARLDSHDIRFDQIDKELVSINSRLDSHDIRFDQIDKELVNINSRLDSHDIHFEKIDKRLDAIEVRLDGIDARLDGIDVRLDAIELNLVQVNKHLVNIDEKLEDHEARFDRLENYIDLRFGGFKEDIINSIEPMFEKMRIDLLGYQLPRPYCRGMLKCSLCETHPSCDLNKLEGLKFKSEHYKDSIVSRTMNIELEQLASVSVVQRSQDILDNHEIRIKKLESKKT